MNNSLRILITDFVWPSTAPEREALVAGLGDGVEVIEAPDGSEATLEALAADCDGIMTCFAQVTPAVVRAAERCRVISRYGVGVDNIAVDVATELGIPVTYVPDYCVDEVSDHVMALLLTWNRQVGFYDGVAKAGRWEGTPSPHPLTRLRGQTIGILGFGRIGRAVADKARAFGLAVITYDPYLPTDAALPNGVTAAWLDDLLAASDYVTVHTPLNDETRGLIGTAAFERMKPSAYIINCGARAYHRRTGAGQRTAGWADRRRRPGRDGISGSAVGPPAVRDGKRDCHASRGFPVAAIGAGTGGTHGSGHRGRAAGAYAGVPGEPSCPAPLAGFAGIIADINAQAMQDF